MKRNYSTLAGPEGAWQIHYRSAGQGEPIVMLHPSPLSSASLAPMIDTLSGQAHCIAWDTPGYGYSDPLPASWSGDGLDPYVEALRCFLDSLELRSPLVYGSATGAQIGIEFSKRHAQRCGGLLLENAALFSAEECAEIADGYFPDITPKDDGSHLQTLWQMARQGSRFFPWNSSDPSADRRGGYAPAAVIDTVVRDHLLAGTDYDRAYRAAFANETLEQLREVTVPTRIVLWDDGMLGPYGERVAEAELPANITVLPAASGMEARLAVLGQAAASLMRKN